MSTVPEAEFGSIRERRRLARQLIIGRELISAEMPPDNFGLIIDLTEDGAAIQAVALLAPGARRLFRCTLPPEPEPLQLTAEVIWSRKNKETGLRFLNVSQEARTRIRKALELLAVDNLPADDQPTPDQTDEFNLDPTPWQAGNASSGSDPVLVSDEQLKSLARRAMDATLASGVAVAVLSNNRFVCRASVGCAPDVGVVLQRETGLSAECIRTRDVVCCPDTSNDSRVNPQVCRELGMASAVIVPVKEGQNVIALLECFWSTAHAYSDASLNELDAIAQALLSRQEGNANFELASAAVGSSNLLENAEKEEQSLLAPERTAVAVADEELVDDLASYDASAAADSDAANDAPDIQTLTDALILPSATPNVLTTALIVTAAFLLMAIPVAWYLWYRNAVPVSTPQAQPVATGPLSASQSRNADQALDSVELPSLSAAAANGMDVPNSRTSREVNMRSVTVTTVTVRPSAAVEFQPLRLIHESPIPASAVHVSGTTSHGSAQLRASASPASSPVNIISESSLRRGTVVLDVTVAKNGAVEEVRVVSGDPLLAEAAKAAVTHWRYQPATVDGSPVQGNARVTVRFRSEDNEQSTPR